MRNFSKITGNNKILGVTLVNNHGISVSVINFGATITELKVPDKGGKLDDIVLGFDEYNRYLNNAPYFGCIIGRYANRIARGKFRIDENEYNLETNNGPNHLHGGREGFDKKFWQQHHTGKKISFYYQSPDQEEGYPGNLEAEVSYTLTDENELILEYKAISDRFTPVNLTNHTYFNLSGLRNTTILDHELQINANHYTPVDDNLIPTGELKSVDTTPMDFRKPMTIGSRFNQLSMVPAGYDHNFVIKNSLDNSLVKAASVFHKNSGRILEVYTTKPGIQLYTGNFLNGSLTGKNDTPYRQYAGLCLETQFFPDSPNQKNFPSPILKPGDIYEHKTIYKFLTFS